MLQKAIRLLLFSRRRPHNLRKNFAHLTFANPDQTKASLLFCIAGKSFLLLPGFPGRALQQNLRSL